MLPCYLLDLHGVHGFYIVGIFGINVRRREEVHIAGRLEEYNTWNHWMTNMLQ